MLKLWNKPDDSVSLDEMAIGQIGVVAKWGACPERVGDIFFRGRENKWFNLSNGECWSPVPDSGWDDDRIRVSIPPVGTLLEIDY